MSLDLPIRALRGRFPAALREGPVVVTSPPGSGKSTLLRAELDLRGAAC